jgi:hypothetical protein
LFVQRQAFNGGRHGFRVKRFRFFVKPRSDVRPMAVLSDVIFRYAGDLVGPLLLRSTHRCKGGLNVV